MRSPSRVRSCFFAFELVVGHWSTCSGAFSVVSLLSGPGVALCFFELIVGLGPPVGRHFHNESSFWVGSFCSGEAPALAGSLAWASQAPGALFHARART